MTTSLQEVSATPWYMAGTEGTGEYRVIARNDAGRIGVRVLEDGDVRVRIEPSGSDGTTALAMHFTAEDGWKQPDFMQPRFSRVFKGAERIQGVEAAIKLLSKEGKLIRHTAERYWRKHVSG